MTQPIFYQLTPSTPDGEDPYIVFDARTALQENANYDLQDLYETFGKETLHKQLGHEPVITYDAELSASYVYGGNRSSLHRFMQVMQKLTGREFIPEDEAEERGYTFVTPETAIKAAHDALKVLTLTTQTAAVLKALDPMAFAQVEQALELLEAL